MIEIIKVNVFCGCICAYICNGSYYTLPHGIMEEFLSKHNV